MYMKDLVLQIVMNARLWISVSGDDMMTAAQTENNGRNWSISLGWSYIVRMKSQLGLGPDTDN